jgi:hypothetical protein
MANHDNRRALEKSVTIRANYILIDSFAKKIATICQRSGNIALAVLLPPRSVAAIIFERD